MKKVIVLAACLFALTTASNAQEATSLKGSVKKERGAKETVEQRAQKSVDALNTIATLTDDQKTKIYDLALNRVKSVDAVREKYQGQADKKETALAEIKEIRKTYHQSVKPLLTADQIAKLKAAKDAKGDKEAKHNTAMEGND